MANPGLLHSPSHKTNLHSPSHYFIISFSIIIYSQSQLIYIDHLVGPHKLVTNVVVAAAVVPDISAGVAIGLDDFVGAAVVPDISAGVAVGLDD